MVDRANLEQVNQLYNEYQSITAAIDNFNAGGSIVQMVVSGGPMLSSTFARNTVAIPTTGIAYPPAMVDVIKTALNERATMIADELGKLGMTVR